MARRRKRIIRRSGFEDTIETNLKALEVAYGYETETFVYHRKIPKGKLALWLPRSGEWTDYNNDQLYKIHEYTPDFIVPRFERPKLYIEAKGRFLGPDRTKMIAMKKEYPYMDLRIMFQYNSKLGLKRTPRALDWAEYYGYTAIVGTKIPKDWL